jgi:hypothetical protein
VNNETQTDESSPWCFLAQVKLAVDCSGLVTADKPKVVQKLLSLILRISQKPVHLNVEEGAEGVFRAELLDS